MARAAVPILLTALMLLAGCGNATPAKPRHTARRAPVHRDLICSDQARTALAAALHVAPGSISTVHSTGSNAYPQCTFRVPRRHGRPLVMLANVNDGPQPYFVLDRQAEEMSQIFGPQRLVAPPTPVTGLGIEAWWFPALEQLGATDGIHLVTTQVLRPHMSLRRQRRLDIVLNRPYLTARVNPNGPLAHGAPAGGVSGATTGVSGSESGAGG